MQLSLSQVCCFFAGFVGTRRTQMVPENVKEPYKFELFHPATKDPLDLYTWRNDFFRPLVEMDKSL